MPRDWDDDSDDLDEWPEDGDPDEADVVGCPKCGAEVYEDAERCPVCGEWIEGSTHPLAGRPWWFVAAGLIGIAAVIGALVLIG